MTEQKHNFTRLWDDEKVYLHRLLVNIVEDIDLADDLLQETYLRAYEKVETYRGGNFRAWLSVIAKNITFAHWRKAYTRAETPILSEHDDIIESEMGTDSHLDILLVRKAVDGLSPILKETLLLKHYGGFNYAEIAERLNCPAGTAKRRVWTAIREIQQSLGIQTGDKIMDKCSEMRLIDYAYGGLLGKDHVKLEKHLAKCEACRNDLADIRSVLTNLDAVKGQLVCVDIVDLHPDGSATTYSPFRLTNRSEQPISSVKFSSMDYHQMRSIFVRDEESTIQIRGTSDDLIDYEIQFERTVAPGESVQGMTVYNTTSGIGASISIGFDRWVAVPDNSGDDAVDVFFVQIVRLPEGARLLGSIPEPCELKDGRKTTLVWKDIVKAGIIRERPVIVYLLAAE
ncbi:MAG: sigma-70 family RNA polymerase sigma factor [Armatimonadota bacterium]